MAETPDFGQDEEGYWRSSKEFVRVLIAELNQSLTANGVWKKKRIEICRTFSFSIANFFDQQWMKVDGKTEYPLLCFVKSFLDLDKELPDITPINCPHKSVELHAMVADEIDWYFNEMKEGKQAVAVGNAGEETEDFEGEQPDIKIKEQPCWTCHGTGQCFCLRKGTGDPTNCSRCQGTGQCRHCGGTGKSPSSPSSN